MQDYYKRNTIDSISAMQSLVELAESKKAEMTPEEIEAKQVELARLKEEQWILFQLQRGLCPNCGHKMIRGKKDKKNDYKRMWTCTSCKSEFSK